MSKNLSREKYEMLATLLTMSAAALAKKTIDKGFEAATGKRAPKNPEADDVSLGEVVLYTAATAAVGVAAKIVVRKLLTQQWKKHDGELPEGIS